MQDRQGGGPTESSPQGAHPRLGFLTIEPLGVVLGSTKWWPTAQAAVDGRVPTREVDNRGRVELPLGGDDSCGVVAWIVGAAGHTVDFLNRSAEVSHLGTMEEGNTFPRGPRLFVLSVPEFCLLLSLWSLGASPLPVPQALYGGAITEGLARSSMGSPGRYSKPG